MLINVLPAVHTFIVSPAVHICIWCSLLVPAWLSYFHSFFMTSFLKLFLIPLPLAEVTFPLLGTFPSYLPRFSFIAPTALFLWLFSSLDYDLFEMTVSFVFKKFSTPSFIKALISSHALTSLLTQVMTHSQLWQWLPHECPSSRLISQDPALNCSTTPVCASVLPWPSPCVSPHHLPTGCAVPKFPLF